MTCPTYKYKILANIFDTKYFANVGKDKRDSIFSNIKADVEAIQELIDNKKFGLYMCCDSSNIYKFEKEVCRFESQAEFKKGDIILVDVYNNGEQKKYEIYNVAYDISDGTHTLYIRVYNSSDDEYKAILDKITEYKQLSEAPQTKERFEYKSQSSPQKLELREVKETFDLFEKIKDFFNKF